MRIRILSPKEMIEGFIGYLAPVNADNTFGNQIRQNIYSFYQVKEITKNVYNNITNSIKV